MTKHPARPIAEAPIEPFNKDKWYIAHSPRLLLWNGVYWAIGQYGYTQKGKGRWQVYGKIFAPTHWLPLPEKQE